MLREFLILWSFNVNNSRSNMNDLLEDQKIHYIVKDYRRMFNNFWALKEKNKILCDTISEKDNEIMLLRAKVNELKKAKPDEVIPKGRIKGLLNDLEAMTKSMTNRLDQQASQIAKINHSVQEFRELIKL